MFIELSMRLPGWSPAILRMPSGFLSPGALLEGASWTGQGWRTTAAEFRSQAQHLPRERSYWIGGESS